MTDDARILIAQHAKTAQLLGVDFLPLGNSSAVEIEEQKTSVLPREQADASARAESFQPIVSGGDHHPEPIASTDLRASYEHFDEPQAKLDALLAKYETQAPHQHFNTDFTNIVFGEGDPSADLMFVGEAPGEEEDLTGRPFVGRAGQLLEKMIQAMGFSRETVYICNVLKTRPPNNATPTAHEASLCEPYLIEQIRIIQPRVIVTLGLAASHQLLATTSPMRSLRGQWQALAEKSENMPAVEVMPTYHPAYLLRSYTEDNRRKVWSDLTHVVERLGDSK
jgi:uracil-DNA glycosylase family 4